MLNENVKRRTIDTVLGEQSADYWFFWWPIIGQSHTKIGGHLILPSKYPEISSFIPPVTMSHDQERAEPKDPVYLMRLIVARCGRHGQADV